MFIGEKKDISSNKKLSDALFILWAGGAALLSYSLVYALRKPFTAATFDGLDFFGMDYKTATSIIQISGYFISKLIGIKVISDLKKENRLKFIIFSVAIAELSLVLFGLLPQPFNVFALFFNGLSLGCLMKVFIPDTKRFKKELDAQRKTVFRSTLFPADKRLVKGSNMEELITEIAYLIKL